MKTAFFNVLERNVDKFHWLNVILHDKYIKFHAYYLINTESSMPTRFVFIVICIIGPSDLWTMSDLSFL